MLSSPPQTGQCAPEFLLIVNAWVRPRVHAHPKWVGAPQGSCSLQMGRCVQGSRCDNGWGLESARKEPALTRTVSPPPQNMCAMEVELESLLGEFSIRMKGTLRATLVFPSSQRHSALPLLLVH